MEKYLFPDQKGTDDYCDDQSKQGNLTSGLQINFTLFR